MPTERPALPASPRLPAGPRVVVAEALARARPVATGGAYLHLNHESAIAAAAALEAKGMVGPLAGLPFAVKDLIAVAGFPLGAGSAVRRDAAPEAAYAPVVATLLNAQAILIGLTSLHEFAFGVTGINDYTGTTVHPQDPRRIAGGSSTGSAAAVAEGSARFALGTDTGGSVRIPAALCGVAGFKPAAGTYPTAGVFPLSPTLDHVGLLAGSVAEVAAVHSVLAGGTAGISRPRRLGVARRQQAQCEPLVRERVERAYRRLATAGCELVAVDDDWPTEERAAEVSTTIMFAEAAAIHRASLASHSDLYGADVRDRLVQGLAITAADYLAALEERGRLQSQMEKMWQELDGVIGPAVGLVAPLIEEACNPQLGRRLVAFTRLANVTGGPALAIPIPGEGLPVGLQLLAADNDRALRFGAYVEKVIAH